MRAGAPRAVIAGGSLAGLNVGLWLRAAGWEVDVLERARAPLEGQGAGIVLNPATVRWFTERAARAPAELGVSVAHLRYLAADGTVAAEHAEPYVLASYDTLYRGLLGAFGRDRYHLGCAVAGAEAGGGGVAAVLAGGARREADLLVWADGIGSTGRRRIAPEAAPHFAGYVAWRGTLPPAELTAGARAALDRAITYCVLGDSHAITYPIPTGAGTVRNWLWYHNVPDGPELEALMTDRAGRRRPVSVPPGAVAPAHVAALRERAAAALPAPLRELVERTPEPFLQAIVDIAVPRLAAGRECLIGDAAFAARPHAAAGSAKAAEDGRTLAAAVAPADVPAALRAWEAGRLTLGAALVARSRAAGEALQSGRWPAGRPLPYGLAATGDSVM